MSRELHREDSNSLTRRAFICLTCAASAVAITPPGFLSKLWPSVIHAPVVSFHMDRPYLDWTGIAEPYIPPAGARSAAVAAQLSDESLRSCLFFI